MSQTKKNNDRTTAREPVERRSRDGTTPKEASGEKKTVSNKSTKTEDSEKNVDDLESQKN